MPKSLCNGSASKDAADGLYLELESLQCCIGPSQSFYKLVKSEKRRKQFYGLKFISNGKQQQVGRSQLSTSIVYFEEEESR